MELCLRTVWILLIGIWMKFCTMWRIFRLWGLCMKVDTIENLGNRCCTT